MKMEEFKSKRKIKIKNYPSGKKNFDDFFRKRIYIKDLDGNILYKGRGTLQKVLEEAVKNNIELPKADLRNQTFDILRITGAKIPGASFEGSEATMLEAPYSDLRGVNFSNVSVKDFCILNKSDAEKAIFKKFKTPSLSISNSIVKEADFSKSQIGFLWLSESDAEKANFNDARSNGFLAQMCKFKEAKFNNFKVEDSFNIRESDAENANFDHFKTTELDAENSNLKETSFIKAEIKYFHLDKADVEKADIGGCGIFDVNYSVPFTVKIFTEDKDVISKGENKYKFGSPYIKNLDKAYNVRKHDLECWQALKPFVEKEEQLNAAKEKELESQKKEVEESRKKKETEIKERETETVNPKRQYHGRVIKEREAKAVNSKTVAADIIKLKAVQGR